LSRDRAAAPECRNGRQGVGYEHKGRAGRARKQGEGRKETQGRAMACSLSDWLRRKLGCSDVGPEARGSESSREEQMERKQQTADRRKRKKVGLGNLSA